MSYCYFTLCDNVLHSSCHGGTLWCTVVVDGVGFFVKGMVVHSPGLLLRMLVPLLSGMISN